MQYSLLARDIEHEILPAAIDQGVGTLVWSPLAQGYLTGKYRGVSEVDGRLTKMDRLDGVDGEKGRRTVDALFDIAAAHDGATPGQIAIAWLLRKPGVTAVLVGPRSVAQLSDNLGAAAIRLSDAEMLRLNEASAPTIPYPLTHQRMSSPDRNPGLLPFVDYKPA